MNDPVQYSREGAIGLIRVVNPPVNALGQAVRAGISAALRQGIDDPDARVLVIYGDGRTFMAGADIREFGKPPLPPMLGAVINEIEACPKPTVAAIHGTALGGGVHSLHGGVGALGGELQHLGGVRFDLRHGRQGKGHQRKIWADPQW